MSDLRDLYQEVVLDHNRRPRNFRSIEDATRQARGVNPLCGDKIKVFVVIEGDVIRDVAFEGDGCAISKASASMMTESLKGKTVAQAQILFDVFHSLVTKGPAEDCDLDELGKLAVFSGVSEYPARVKCATLAWHTVQAALHGEDQPVSTE